MNQEQDFHRALALPPAWQLSANGSGHVLATTPSMLGANLAGGSPPPSSSPHCSPHSPFVTSQPTPPPASSSTTWPKQTLLSEAYPPGARTPLRRPPTPEHEPPQLPDPDTIAMQLQQEEGGGAQILNVAAPVLLFEQHEARGSTAGSPFDDMVVPELDAFQARASMATAVEELGFHSGIGNNILFASNNIKAAAAAAILKPKPVPGFAEMLRRTAPPISNTKSMTRMPAAAAAHAAQSNTNRTTGFDALDALGLLDGLDASAPPTAVAAAPAAPALSSSMMKMPTPSAFTGELSKFFAESAASSGGNAAARDAIAEVPEAGSPIVMDVDAHNSPLATPVFTAAPADSPFGSPSATAAAAAGSNAGGASASMRRSGRAAKKTQPFDNSGAATSGGAAKSGKGRRAYAALATRGTAEKGGKGAGASPSGRGSASSSAGKKAPAAMARPPRAKKVQPTLAALDSTGALPADHKPARGRGRQLQLAKMTAAQKKAESKARLEKNRQAARGFRARRKNHVFELEQQIAGYEQRDRAQLDAIEDLKLQIAEMQQLSGQSVGTQ